MSESKIVNSLKPITPYMLRNDGVLLECGSIHPYIKRYFKYDLEQSIKEFETHRQDLDWFYDNTKNEELKKAIDDFRNEPTVNNFSLVNYLSNQEFCRVRTSNIKINYGGDNGEIYFRISSEGFSWFDLIWDVVFKNRNNFETVTVVKDSQTFGGDYDYYWVGKNKLNHISVDDFLTLSGNPLLENYKSKNIKEDLKYLLRPTILLEKKRSELISKSKAGDNYAKNNQYRGRNRWERRKWSKISTSVSDYNRIDMNTFWKEDLLEFGIKVQGETNNYVVTVTFENILSRLRDEIKRNNNKLEFKNILRALINTFNSEDVYISCTCPDWVYSGMNFYGYRQGYNSDPQFGKAMQAPVIRNPNDSKGAGCKHINLVLANLSWMMKITSVINNYIWYCKDNMEYNYARYIFPKLYNMDYDKAIQLTLFDSDELESDENIINLSNALGRRRTQFKPKGVEGGNPRFERPPVEREDPNQLKLDLDYEDEEELNSDEEAKLNDNQ